MEEQVRELLELYSIEEALEVLDVTEEECISILLRHGYAVLPPFLDEVLDEYDGTEKSPTDTEYIE